jgi:hypothetical protein
VRPGFAQLDELVLGHGLVQLPGWIAFLLFKKRGNINSWNKKYFQK